VTTPKTPPSPGRTLGALTSGARVGRFTVVTAEPELLVLRGHIGASVLMVIGGLLLTVWGVFPWMALVIGSDQSIPLKALAIAPGGMALVAAGVVQATRRYTFDARQQSLVCSTRFRKPQVYPRSAFSLIAINVLPTNLQQRETVQLRLRQFVSENSGILIGARRSNKKDTVYLVLAAIEIARLLDHSIEVRGQCKEGGPALLHALATASTIVRAPTPNAPQG